MHEPGPPRATSVGRPVELAPRNPDPDGRYAWTVQHTPAASEGSVLVPGETSRPDDPVVHLDPDAPGTYDLTLEAPDGTHRQRVRVFPDERRETTIRVPVSDLPLPDASVHRVSILWRHNDRLLARDRPTREGDAWVYRTQIPPGRHDVGFVLNDDRSTEHHCTHTVPGPGRPRVSLSGRVTADESSTDETHSRLVVTATVEGAPTLDVDPSLTRPRRRRRLLSRRRPRRRPGDGRGGRIEVRRATGCDDTSAIGAARDAPRRRSDPRGTTRDATRTDGDAADSSRTRWVGVGHRPASIARLGVVTGRV